MDDSRWPVWYKETAYLLTLNLILNRNQIVNRTYIISPKYYPAYSCPLSLVDALHMSGSDSRRDPQQDIQRHTRPFSETLRQGRSGRLCAAL